MQWLDNLVDKWEAFKQKPRPGLEKTGRGLKKTTTFLSKLWHYMFIFRGLILSAPVVTVAIILASKCSTDLPESVMITLPAIDTASDASVFGFLVFNAQYITRSMAVTAPLVLTIACLLLTICSKRIFYPWLISVFTLIVPIFLLVSNQYL